MNNPQPWFEMPATELAATILPFFSAATWEDIQHWIVGIVSWLNTGSYGPLSDIPVRSLAMQRSVEFENPDVRAVVEAMQVLEHAGLVLRGFLGSHPTHLGLTRLGMHALATNTVRQHLGLPDAMPTANPGGSGSGSE